MAGYVPYPFRALLLEALAGRTAVSATTVYLGLATAVPDDPQTATLANITEVATAGYARKSIPNFNAANPANPVQITTPTAFSFTALSADMASPASYAFITDVATGGQLADPVVTKGTTATSGGTFAAGTYYWTVTAINARGETLQSNEVSATLVSTGTQVLNWSTISGATGYKVYRGTAAGQENVLVTTLGTVTTYTDTGSAGTPSTTPPINDTTASLRYLFELPEPLLARAGEPINIPASTLIIE